MYAIGTKPAMTVSGWPPSYITGLPWYYLPDSALVMKPTGYGSTFRLFPFVAGEGWRTWALEQSSLMVPPRTSEDLSQLSLQKVYGKIRSSDLDLGEALGEYKETINMLRSPLKNLKKFLLDDRARNLRLLRALAQKDRRDVALLLGRTGYASLETMSDTWLELRYGIRPMYMLIQEIIERVNAEQRSILDPKKIRSRRSRLTFTDKTTVKPYFGIADCGMRCSATVEDVYTSVASVQYTQVSPDSVLDTLGLTPRFLPEVAWELTGCSFVWDWFFTIGPWLATLRIKPGINILGNTSGFGHQRKVTLNDLSIRFENPVTPWREIEGALSSEEGQKNASLTESYDRKVNVDLEYLPHFTWGRTLDLFKAIDSVALIWSRIDKKSIKTWFHKRRF
jgi:hypothetical protein